MKVTLYFRDTTRYPISQDFKEVWYEYDGKLELQYIALIDHNGDQHQYAITSIRTFLIQESIE